MILQAQIPIKQEAIANSVGELRFDCRSSHHGLLPADEEHPADTEHPADIENLANKKNPLR
jgi:hypothetical protein